jgi:hypothetical protein
MPFLTSTLKTTALVPSLGQHFSGFSEGFYDSLWAKAGSPPSLDINFATDRSLIDRVSGQNLITFTRSTTKDFIGANGQWQTAGINELPLIYDPTTLKCLGIQTDIGRTNLLLNSDTLSGQSVSVTAAAHTLSFYGAGTVTLSGAATATLTGSGDFPTRSILTFTPTAGTLTLTVTGSVRYGQLELGASASTYIATTGNTRLRASDVPIISGANFSSFWSATENTVYVEGYVTPSNAGANYPFFAANNATSSELWRGVWIGGSGIIQCAVTSGGVSQGAPFLAGLPVGTAIKMLQTVKTNFMNLSVNGVGGVADTSVVPPVPDRLCLGCQGTGQSQGGHIISRIVVWPRDIFAKGSVLTA